MKELYFKTEYGNMHYEIKGTGKIIVLLHGWGKSLEDFRSVIDRLSENNKVISVDFLGFGLSDNPTKDLNLYDYVYCLRCLINYLNARDITMVGHSFGGRVAILYSSIYKVSKLILANSAGFKKRSFKQYKDIVKYKILKVIYYLFGLITNKDKYHEFISSSGSSDYINTSIEMKKTFSKIVSFDLTKHMKKINNAYIISGVNDCIVPFEDGVKMNKIIANSSIYPFYKSGHFTYHDEENKFIRLINKIGE